MQRLVLGALILITVSVLLFMVAMLWMSVGARSAPDGPAPSRAEIDAALGARPDEVAVAPSGLVIPVAGVRAGQLSDTFTQSRSGGRVHDAIDIMAPRGTLVVAAAEGTVEKLFLSQGGGGITAYVRSPDRAWTYYYAHLDGYAPGLHEGQRLRRGDPIGRVGSTGNASPDGPHLHFAIHLMAPADRWWQGRAVNPYPLLAARDAHR